MNIKNTKNIDIQYFGDIECYLYLIKLKHIYFNNALYHSKGVNINRTLILGANKVLMLSVPLEGGRSVKSFVKDIRIANKEPWQRIHWRSIHDSYRKAPWFEEYAPELDSIYRKSYMFLWDWNIEIIRWVLDSLKWNYVILSEENGPSTESESQLELPYSGVKQSDALSNSANKISNMHGDYPQYQQVFSDKLGFHPNLSILDLIMNEGPIATDYLTQVAAYYAANPG